MKKATTEETTEVKKRVRRSYRYAVGKRKTAVARVRLFKNGEGKITVNEKDYKVFFPHFELQDTVVAPLKAAGLLTDFNFSIKTQGGGIRGQAEAVRHGISNVLLKIDKAYRPTLKPLGFLKRDPRKKERKKPGLKRARRAPQWAKR